MKIVSSLFELGVGGVGGTGPGGVGVGVTSV